MTALGDRAATVTAQPQPLVTTEAKRSRVLCQHHLQCPRPIRKLLLNRQSLHSPSRTSRSKVPRFSGKHSNTISTVRRTQLCFAMREKQRPRKVVAVKSARPQSTVNEPSDHGSVLPVPKAPSPDVIEAAHILVAMTNSRSTNTSQLSSTTPAENAAEVDGSLGQQVLTWTNSNINHDHNARHSDHPVPSPKRAKFFKAPPVHRPSDHDIQAAGYSGHGSGYTSPLNNVSAKPLEQPQPQPPPSSHYGYQLHAPPISKPTAKRYPRIQPPPPYRRVALNEVPSPACHFKHAQLPLMPNTNFPANRPALSGLLAMPSILTPPSMTAVVRDPNIAGIRTSFSRQSHRSTNVDTGEAGTPGTHSLLPQLPPSSAIDRISATSLSDPRVTAPANPQPELMPASVRPEPADAVSAADDSLALDIFVRPPFVGDRALNLAAARRYLQEQQWYGLTPIQPPDVDKQYRDLLAAAIDFSDYHDKPKLIMRFFKQTHGDYISDHDIQIACYASAVSSRRVLSGIIMNT